MDTISDGSVPGGLPPPPGVVPNFAHPYSLQKYGVPTKVACLSITSLIVILRMYAKAFITRNLGRDDCKAPYLGNCSSCDVH